MKADIKKAVAYINEISGKTVVDSHNMVHIDNDGLIEFRIVAIGATGRFSDIAFDMYRKLKTQYTTALGIEPKGDNDGNHLSEHIAYFKVGHKRGVELDFKVNEGLFVCLVDRN